MKINLQTLFAAAALLPLVAQALPGPTLSNELSAQTIKTENAIAPPSRLHKRLREESNNEYHGRKEAEHTERAQHHMERMQHHQAEATHHLNRANHHYDNGDYRRSGKSMAKHQDHTDAAQEHRDALDHHMRKAAQHAESKVHPSEDFIPYQHPRNNAHH